MRARWVAAFLGTVVAILSIGATSAFAATEVGNGCEGNAATPSPFPVISLVNGPGDPLPAAIPSSGVITQWKLKVVTIPANYLSQAVEVFRPTSTPKTYLLVGESSPGILSSGVNTFPTRIPVHAGDRLGLTSAPGGALNETLYCVTTNTGDVIGKAAGPAAPNAALAFPTETTSAQVPVIATVEPDVDGDGFGDETQDHCPQSAGFQIPCPDVHFSVNNLVSKGSVLVLVSTTSAAPVKVSATARLGHGKVAKLRTRGKTVNPGQIGHFRLRFSNKLKSKLKELTTGQLLNLSVHVSAKNVAGAVIKRSFTVRLRGQG